MHNLVANVFKLVGGAIIFALLLDLVLFLVDVSNATTQIQSVMGLMCTEVTKNNCLIGVTESDAVGTSNTFNALFEKIDDNSQFYTYEPSANVANFKNISETNIGNYGEIKEVKIQFTLNQFGREVKNDGGYVTIEGDNTSKGLKIEFKTSVPCLRYIK